MHADNGGVDHLDSGIMGIGILWCGSKQRPAAT